MRLRLLPLLLPRYHHLICWACINCRSYVDVTFLGKLAKITFLLHYRSHDPQGAAGNIASPTGVTTLATLTQVCASLCPCIAFSASFVSNICSQDGYVIHTKREIMCLLLPLPRILPQQQLPLQWYYDNIRRALISCCPCVVVTCLRKLTYITLVSHPQARTTVDRKGIKEKEGKGMEGKGIKEGENVRAWLRICAESCISSTS